MKTFKELKPEEKTLAIRMEVHLICEMLASGEMVLPDLEAQTRVHTARMTAVRRLTPEHAPQYIYGSLKVYIDSMAASLVETNLYSEPHEVVRDSIVGMADPFH